MPFMTIHTEYGKWYQVGHLDGSSETVPEDCLIVSADDTVTGPTEGYCARLSASGYLDCTDWVGPFPTEEEARAACSESMDVCVHCSDQCWEDSDPKCAAGALDRAMHYLDSVLRPGKGLGNLEISDDVKRANRVLYLDSMKEELATFFKIATEEEAEELAARIVACVEAVK